MEFKLIKYLDAIRDCFIFHVLEMSPELLPYHRLEWRCLFMLSVILRQASCFIFLRTYQLKINWKDMQNYMRLVFDYIFTGNGVFAQAEDYFGPNPEEELRINILT